MDEVDGMAGNEDRGGNAGVYCAHKFLSYRQTRVALFAVYCRLLLSLSFPSLSNPDDQDDQNTYHLHMQ